MCKLITLTLILTRDPTKSCHFENQSDWEHDVCLRNTNVKFVCWSIHKPCFWIHKQLFEPKVLKYQPDGEQNTAIYLSS